MKAMFERNWNENKDNEIDIKDFEYNTMLIMVQFMYSGQVDFSNVDEAVKVLTAADKYDVQSLKSMRGEYIAICWNDANVLTCIVEAEKLKSDPLLEGCIKYLGKLDRSTLTIIKESEEWKRLEKNLFFRSIYKCLVEMSVTPS